MKEYSYLRAIIPNGKRRAKWHDYHSKCIYMITINMADYDKVLSHISGSLTDVKNPPRTILTPLGEMIKRQLQLTTYHFSTIKILAEVYMPDHIHFVIYNTTDTSYHLSDVIRYFKSLCTHSYYNIPADQHITSSSIFEKGYHDRILMKSNQLAAMKNYVRVNPRRLLERRQFTTFHQRHKLVSTDGVPYEAYGNIHLLQDYDIEAVRVSSKYTPDFLRKRRYCWYHTVLNGGVLVSPFISPKEHKVRDWATESGGRLIIITENGFGDRYTPKGILHTLISEGRLLLIAPTHHSTSKVAISRQWCLEANNLAEKIAAQQYLRPL